MRAFWRVADKGHSLDTHGEWIKKIEKKNRKQGTSAPTLATAWSGLVDVNAALSDAPALEGFVIEHLIVEAQAEVDEYDGGRRNHDVVLRGRTGAREAAVVCVEAKAGESLGNTVARQRELAVQEREKKKLMNKTTNAVKRVDELVERFAPAGAGTEAVGKLRYQLFTALAGTISEARTADASHAVLLIHDFLTDKRPREATALKHDVELSAFSTAVFANATPQAGGKPWCAPVGVFHDAPGVQLYLAHVITDLRKSTLRAGLPDDGT